ncbi:hypothetical protein BASA81_012417 [Batrachochytrium salamandrivorans]|nr:hypothetical protein BASA81_012417 [Batrachochytrium salamandrivorans]
MESPDLSLYWREFVHETQSTPHSCSQASSSQAVECSPQKEIFFSRLEEEEEGVDLVSLVEGARFRQSLVLAKRRRRLEWELGEVISHQQDRFLQLAETQEEEAIVVEGPLLLGELVDQVVEMLVDQVVALVVEQQAVELPAIQVAPLEEGRASLEVAPMVVETAPMVMEAAPTATETEKHVLLVVAEQTTPTTEEEAGEESLPMPEEVEKSAPPLPNDLELRYIAAALELDERSREEITPPPSAFPQRKFVFYDDNPSVATTATTKTTTIAPRSQQPLLRTPMATPSLSRPLGRPHNHLHKVGLHRLPNTPTPLPAAAMSRQSEPIQVPPHLKQSLEQAKQVLYPPTTTMSADSDSVGSLFSTGRGAQVRLSRQALDKAAAAGDQPLLTPQRHVKDYGEGEEEDTPMQPVFQTPPPPPPPPPQVVQSLFSTGSNKSISISKSALSRAQEFASAEAVSEFTPKVAAAIPSPPLLTVVSPKAVVPKVVISTPTVVPLTPTVVTSTTVAQPPRPRPYQPLPRLRVPVDSVCSLPVTSANAVCVSFALDQGNAMISDSPCAWTLGTLHNKLKGPSMEWIANHFRWVVWKLNCQNRISLLLSHRLTLANVTQQLERRKLETRKSFLQRIVAREISIVDQVFVVVLSRVMCTSTGAGLVTGEVSDGWYAMECQFDETLSAKARQNQLVVGQKLVVSFCQLVDLPSVAGTCALELDCNNLLHQSVGGAQPRLLIGANSSRPANWDARLGQKSKSSTVTKTLAAIRPTKLEFGLNVSRICLLVVRASPLLFRENLPQGKHVVRNLAEDEAVRGENSQRQVAEFVRLSVVDLSTPRGKMVPVTVWYPSPELLSLVCDEGKAFEVTNCTITKGVGEVRLSMGRQTKWTEISPLKFAPAALPRQVVEELSSLLPHAVVDLVLVWVHSDKDDMIGYGIHPNRPDRLLAVTFAARQTSLFHVLPFSTVVCCRDLFFKGVDMATGVFHFTVIDVTSFAFDQDALETGRLGFRHFVQEFLSVSEWEEDEVLDAAQQRAMSQGRKPATTPLSPMSSNSPQSPLVRLPLNNNALSFLTVGKKLVDARRFRGPVTAVQPGTRVRFECGQNMKQDCLVTRVQVYSSYHHLLKQERFKLVCPWAQSLDQALEELSRDGNQGQVVALEFDVIDVYQTAPLVLSAHKKPKIMKI